MLKATILLAAIAFLTGCSRAAPTFPPVEAITALPPISPETATLPKSHFEISVTGAEYPIVTGSTDLPEGTRLLVIVKKPWLRDGSERLARGLAACGDDCLPATLPDRLFGAIVSVVQGRFTAGPFSFNGKPFHQGTYPLEISLSVDVRTATIEQIHAIGTVLYNGTIEVRLVP